VVGSKEAKKGITGTKRLTLSDGTVTHDASFQAIDEHKSQKQIGMTTELKLRGLLQVQYRCLCAG